MEQFKLKIQLSINGNKQKEYLIDSLPYQCQDFEIVGGLHDNDYNIDINCKSTISHLGVLLSIPNPSQYKDNYYSNGYQSWSLSREYSKTDRQPSIATIIRPLVRHFGGEACGDYSFVDYSNKKGIINSCSHTYFRNNNSRDITLFGSTNERSGYTYFTYSYHSDILYVTKDLEGITIDSSYNILSFKKIEGDYDKAFDSYFQSLGVTCKSTKKLNGYTSWYNYYRNIDEKIITRDLESLVSINNSDINCFQIDDGYQTYIGDLTDINPAKFPNGLTPLVERIHSHNLLAGIWLCPFGATKKSRVYKEHYDWILKDKLNRPIKVGAAWGGFYCLDFYNDAVRDYIRTSIKTMIDEWGFDMLKMDFLYCACLIPRINKTRASIMYEAMAFLRECAGDKIILGCGVPLMPAFGVVDYCRIGADVSMSYAPSLDYSICNEIVSTRKTILNTIFRNYLDGRAFCNDPDVFILRENNNSLDSQQQLLLGSINMMFGSVLFCSDNIADYSPKQLATFKFLIQNNDILISDSSINGNLVTIKYTMAGVDRILSFNHKTGIIELDQVHSKSVLPAQLEE